MATALQRLGTPTAFVSALGTDDRGEEIMTLLEGGWTVLLNVHHVDGFHSIRVGAWKDIHNDCICKAAQGMHGRSVCW